MLENLRQCLLFTTEIQIQGEREHRDPANFSCCFTLRSSQQKLFRTNLTSQTYTYNAISKSQNILATHPQLLVCIQGILKILFSICELRTNPPQSSITTYTYNTIARTDGPVCPSSSYTKKIPSTTALLPAYGKNNNNTSTYKDP